MAREAFRLAGTSFRSHQVHDAGGAAVKATESREQIRTEHRRAQEARLKSSSGELFKARFKNHTNQLDDTAKLRGLRRDIARIKTVLTAARAPG